MAQSWTPPEALLVVVFKLLHFSELQFPPQENADDSFRRMKENHVEAASAKRSAEDDVNMVCSGPLDNVGFD